MERIFYRVITPCAFSNLEFDTLDDAIHMKKLFSDTDSVEYKEYWKTQGDSCKIVKVTEIIEELYYTKYGNICAQGI